MGFSGENSLQFLSKSESLIIIKLLSDCYRSFLLSLFRSLTTVAFIRSSLFLSSVSTAVLVLLSSFGFLTGISIPLFGIGKILHTVSLTRAS